MLVIGMKNKKARHIEQAAPMLRAMRRHSMTGLLFISLLPINEPAVADWSDKSDWGIARALPATAFRTPDKTSAL